MSRPFPNFPLESTLNLIHDAYAHLSAGIRLAPDCGPLAMALSQDGLGFKLTDIQSLLLALIGWSRGFDSPPPDESGDYYDLLMRLIGSGDESPRLWLPPGAEIFSGNGNRCARFASPITILLCVAGRRSGKTTIASILFAWLARRMLLDKRFLEETSLLPGSIVSLLNVACDANQARILFGMLVRNLRTLELLPKDKSPVERIGLGAGERVQIESLTSSSRSVRGRTAIGVCFDEFAHFQRTGGPLADRAMWLALTPSLATFGPKGLAIVTTTPAGRSGVVWELFQQRGLREGMLTVQIPTWEMNPAVSREQLEEEFVRDEFLARQEYGAEFLAPHGRFLREVDIAACVPKVELEGRIPHARRHIHVDLGLSHDATAIAVGRIEAEAGDDRARVDSALPGKRIVIERVEVFQGTESRPVNVGDVEQRVISMVSEIQGGGRAPCPVTFDQYQSAYIVDRLRSRGINAHIIPATARSNQESYALLRDLIATGRISLPDHARLLDELGGLECTPTPGGFKVEAPSTGTDDCADAVAMCVWCLMHEDDEWEDMMSVVERGG